jgi:hypothetical protein
MPAVGDLYGLRRRARRRLSVPAAAVARHGGDLRMGGQPRLDSSDLPVGQQVDDPPLLQVTK